MGEGKYRYFCNHTLYSPICPFVLRLLRTPKAIDGRRQAKYKNSVVETNLEMVWRPLMPVGTEIDACLSNYICKEGVVVILCFHMIVMLITVTAIVKKKKRDER